MFLGEIRRGVFTVSKETVKAAREDQGGEVRGDPAASIRIRAHHTMDSAFPFHDFSEDGKRQ